MGVETGSDGHRYIGTGVWSKVPRAGGVYDYPDRLALPAPRRPGGLRTALPPQLRTGMSIRVVLTSAGPSSSWTGRLAEPFPSKCVAKE